MLKPSEWDRHTLPSNLYQKNGPLHGESSSASPPPGGGTTLSAPVASDPRGFIGPPRDHRTPAGSSVAAVT